MVSGGNHVTMCRPDYVQLEEGSRRRTRGSRPCRVPTQCPVPGTHARSGHKTMQRWATHRDLGARRRVPFSLVSGERDGQGRRRKNNWPLNGNAPTNEGVFQKPSRFL
ncbi:hypothetical protein AVEN_236228-1 [Araneus ventricosus]|uniref:Uncharacterized protein n=1 Tax=Araneus ventricosus TaxID=182803 RepID=A0A4Y2CAX4_ARAVE|nr:hypothetical protein AVEN_236228-1 [Araneus ventricosus]